MQKTVIDQLGNEVTFNYPPKKIISIVPFQTELLFVLSLDEEVIGITKYCNGFEVRIKTTSGIS